MPDHAHQTVIEPGPRGFVWPPAPGPGAHPPSLPPLPPPLPSPPSDDARAARAEPHALIESIETELLGRTGLSFDRWAARTGWARDERDDYCWRCGGSVGPHETDGEGCAECRVMRVPWDRAIRLARYRGVIRDEVLALKFNAWRPTGVGLGMHLGRAIGDELKRAQITPHEAALIPVPMHRLRRMARGVDHTLVLARAAGKASGCPVRRVLGARHRPEQVGLSATARAANIRGAFFVQRRHARSVRRSTAPRARVWVLIDDVRTTGATFGAATRALRQGLRSRGVKRRDQPEIWACCVGVAGERRRLLDAGLGGDMLAGEHP